jgi:hypothetical protein
MAEEKLGSVVVSPQAIVSVHRNALGGVAIFYSDESRDLLCVTRISGPRKYSASAEARTTLRRNFGHTAGDNIAQSTLAVEAPVIGPAEHARLRARAGLPPRQAFEFVGVKFKEYSSPAEAAADSHSTGSAPEQRVWVYRADKALKLTVGERVTCPIGDRWEYRVDTLVGTVVSLNQLDPTSHCGYVKDVDGRA